MLPLDFGRKVFGQNRPDPKTIIVAANFPPTGHLGALYIVDALQNGANEQIARLSA